MRRSGDTPAGADEERRAVDEARALLQRLADLVDEDETVLDMAPAVSAGHDGILVATDRRVLFLAPRRTDAHAYDDVASRLRDRSLVRRASDDADENGPRGDRRVFAPAAGRDRGHRPCGQSDELSARNRTGVARRASRG